MTKHQWVRKWNSWVEAQPTLPGVYRRKEGGFWFEGERSIRRMERRAQRYSTAQGHEQEQAIARIVDLTRVKRHIAASNPSMDSKRDSTGGQHEKTG